MDVNDLRRRCYERLNLYGSLRHAPGPDHDARLPHGPCTAPHLSLPAPGSPATSAGAQRRRAFNVLFALRQRHRLQRAYPGLQDIWSLVISSMRPGSGGPGCGWGGAQSVAGWRFVDRRAVRRVVQPVMAATMPKMIFDIREGDYLLQARASLYFDTSSPWGCRWRCNALRDPFAAPRMYLRPRKWCL
jgi:hypothetical protein